MTAISNSLTSDFQPVVSQRSAIDYLLDHPRAFPDLPSQVELRETHISWVLLTRDYAYKVKKPVAFDFLDFSTLEKRHRACLQELQLNQRFSSNVYLGVVPLTLWNGGFRIDGSGPVVDWVVKMRRLPDELTLASGLESGRLSYVQTNQLSQYLVQQLSALAPAVIQSERFVDRWYKHVHDNQQVLSVKAPDFDTLIQRVHAGQLRFLEEHADLLKDRVCDGRIVDGHGDLKPEHIYLLASPVLLDCIDFSAEYRENDILDELSFLAMECDGLKSPTVGRTLLQRYREAIQDDFPDELFGFYKSYRACVRAKVNALRGQQWPENSRLRQAVETYLTQADRYLQPADSATLVVVCGMMGSGKSTLAEHLASLLQAPLIQSDAVRSELFNGSQPAGEFGRGKYSDENRGRVYAEMARRCEKHLSDSQVVILDATYAAESHRARLRELAHSHHARFMMVLCACPRDVAIQRITRRLHSGQRNRSAPSEARPQWYDQQAERFAPLSSSDEHVCVDTTADLRVQLDSILTVLDSRRQDLVEV